MPFRQPFLHLIVLSLLAFTFKSSAKDIALVNDSKEDISPTTMSYKDAVIYGLVEGVTEFLPISSTGHLVITSELLGSGKSNSIQQQALHAYLIVIQSGAILAVALIYRSRVWSMFTGIFGRDDKGRKLFINLVMAFLPAAFLGVLLDDLIESYLFGLLPIAVALLAGAIFIGWAGGNKKARDESPSNTEEKSIESLTIKSSVFIGFLQCFAMWPGTSRSMMTIVGGYIVGLKRTHAAEFSFLLGLVTLTAAAGYKGFTKWASMSEYLTIGPVLVGCFVAGISAGLSVFWLVGYLTRRGLGVFVFYRIILSIVIFTLYFVD